MTKTKLFLPLFVILVMGMATSAFAQLNCDVASTPVSRASATGHTEQVGDLSFTCAGGATATSAAVVTINYPGLAAITNNTTNPPIHPIVITGVTGFPGGGPTVTSVSNTTGQIVIQIPAQPVPAVANTFTLTGVLASLVGTGLTTLTANVSVNPGSNVLITAGQNVATVITSVQPTPISAAGPAIPALYFSGTALAVPGRATTTFTITENYIDFFRNNSATQYATATHDTQLLITFSGAPAGAFLTGCTAVANPGALVVNVVTAPSATNATLLLDFGADLNLGVVETVTVTCTGLNAPTTLPTTATAITATVTAAPVGTAFCSSVAGTTGSATGTFVCISAGTNAAPGAGAVPRFANTPVSIGTVLNFTPNTTTMIIPYALGDPAAVPPAGVFDTGIAIANTSTDVVGTTSIFAAGGATAQSGTITFSFFPQDGVAANRFSFTTPAIAAGASYVANVSDILKAAGRTASFSGYIIAVANFTNAHGMAFVYGGTAAGRLTSATDVLVIPSPILNPRTATGGIGFVVDATTK
jgi:hypothetical protein